MRRLYARHLPTIAALAAGASVFQGCNGAPGPLRVFGGPEGLFTGLTTVLLGELALSALAVLLGGVQIATAGGV